MFLKQESKEVKNGAVVFHNFGKGCILHFFLFCRAGKSFSGFELAF